MASNFGTDDARLFGELFGPSTTPHLFGELGTAIEIATVRWIEGSGRNRLTDSAGRPVSVIDGFGGLRHLEGGQ